MNSEQIFKAIGEADTTLLNRCETTKSRHSVWIHWGAMAACLCLFWAAGSVLSLNHTKNGIIVPGATEQIVASFPTDNGSGIYEAPANGTVLLYNEVRAALEQDAGRNQTYFLAIDIYQDGVPLEPDSNAVKNEIKRLNKNGYRVGYTDSWTYQDNLEKGDFIYTAGYFTQTQINAITANKDYGYAFYFAVNGDDSPVPAEKGLRKAP